jgi:hypothetical protein
MTRRTKFEHFERGLPPKKEKKITREEAQDILNRVFKRAAIERGLVDPTKGKFRFQWHYDGETGEVEANSRSEARGLVKKALGIGKSGRLPLGLALFAVGVVQGRDVPLLAVIGKN